jgi:Ca2+-binding RTX toxin-like protein
MTVYNASSIYGQTIDFDPNTDSIVFTDTSLFGVNVPSIAQGGDGTHVQYVNGVTGEQIIFANLDMRSLDSDNFVLVGGGQVLIGDNTHGTADDDLGNLLVSNGLGSSVLYGLGGDDTLVGSGSDDVLFGGDGADSVSGGIYLYGGSGNDALTATAGKSLSLLAGGSGDDTLNGNGNPYAFGAYFDASAPVTVNLLTSGPRNTGGGGIDTLIGIHNLEGSLFNDVLTGDNAGDLIIGISGTDTIYGGSGKDTIWGDGLLYGGGGNDTLRGGPANDTLDGGKGINTASYDNIFPSVVVSLAIAGPQNTGGGGVDTLTHIQNLVGGFGDDSLTGDIHNNALSGGNGNDSLYGGGGNDTLDGGAGDDSLDGGTGINTASYADATAGVGVSLASSGPQATLGAGTDTLANIQSLIGSHFNDTLEGSGGANTLDGGLGKDTVTFADATSSVTVSLAIAGPQNTLGYGVETLRSIENLVGSGHDDVLTGSTSVNALYGGAGDDTLIGGKGADMLTGGAGADHFAYQLASESLLTAKDTITDFSHAEGDQIDLHLISPSFTLAGSSFTHVADQLIQIAKPGGYLVEGDVNGDGKADFAIMVDTAAALAPGDFVL